MDIVIRRYVWRMFTHSLILSLFITKYHIPKHLSLSPFLFITKLKMPHTKTYLSLPFFIAKYHISKHLSLSLLSLFFITKYHISKHSLSLFYQIPHIKKFFSLPFIHYKMPHIKTSFSPSLFSLLNTT